MKKFVACLLMCAFCLAVTVGCGGGEKKPAAKPAAPAAGGGEKPKEEAKH